MTRAERPISGKNGWRCTGKGSNIRLDIYGTYPRETNRAHVDLNRTLPPQMLPLSMHVPMDARLQGPYHLVA